MHAKGTQRHSKVRVYGYMGTLGTWLHGYILGTWVYLGYIGTLGTRVRWVFMLTDLIQVLYQPDWNRKPYLGEQII
jgi:hypothetical protein